MPYIDKDNVLDRLFWGLVMPLPWSGCWIFMGALNHKNGYGVVSVHGKPRLVHRVVYERLVGKIPAKLTIDHKCRVITCCNPDHLEAVTLQENIRRSTNSISNVNARKTHCPQGHPYSGGNLFIDIAGTRRCKICVKERDKERYLRKKYGY